VAKKLIEVYKLQSQPISDSRACFDFAHTMKPGDRVFAKRDRDEVVGYGVVTGDYEYREDRAQFKRDQGWRLSSITVTLRRGKTWSKFAPFMFRLSSAGTMDSGCASSLTA